MHSGRRLVQNKYALHKFLEVYAVFLQNIYNYFIDSFATYRFLSRFWSVQLICCFHLSWSSVSALKCQKIFPATKIGILLPAPTFFPGAGIGFVGEVIRKTSVFLISFLTRSGNAKRPGWAIEVGKLCFGSSRKQDLSKWSFFALILLSGLANGKIRMFIEPVFSNL